MCFYILLPLMRIVSRAKDSSETSNLSVVQIEVSELRN